VGDGGPLPPVRLSAKERIERVAGMLAFGEFDLL